MIDAHENPVPLERLARRIYLGEPEAAAELYEFVTLGIRAYLSRQLEPQDFNDGLHDVFLEVLRALKRGQLRNPERLMGFVSTVARRKVAGYIDCAARNRRTRVEMEPGLALSSSCLTPDRALILDQQRELVSRTLTRLPARGREILWRFYIQEQHQIQICAEMGLSRTQFRLLKWRSKAQFVQLSRKSMGSS